MRRRHRSSAIQASKKIKKQLSVKSKSIIEKQNSLKIIKKPKTALASKSKKDQKLKIKVSKLATECKIFLALHAKG